MKAKKTLGQNFLKSEKILEEIIKAGDIKKDDVVLEIGPGTGFLTEKILETGSVLYAIEKDQRMIPLLSEKFGKKIEEERFHIFYGDILNMECDFLPQKYKIVANIPYYITGAILRKFLSSQKTPTSMTLLVQKEVAERIVAKNKKESLLSVSVKSYGTPKYIKTVSRNFFTPSPNVDSAILDIKNISKEKFENIDENFFFEIIHLAFAHKRKQILGNLSEKLDKEKVLLALQKTKIDPKSRAEDIAIEKWFEFVKNLI